MRAASFWKYFLLLVIVGNLVLAAYVLTGGFSTKRKNEPIPVSTNSPVKK